MFGGTIEGRELAGECARQGWDCHVYVATDIGEEFLRQLPVTVHVGRLKAEEMAEELAGLEPVIVLDATHPYAVEVSENIRSACEDVGLRCVRVLRNESSVRGDIEVSSAEEAAKILREQFSAVPVLLTTGSKELQAFAGAAGEIPDLYVRILPGEANRALALEAGICPVHIIAGVGPYSEEENLRIIHRYGIRVLVTKESGRQGGYEEKIRAASRAGAVSIVIRRPAQTGGVTMKEAQKIIKNESSAKQVTVIGCGMGGRGGMTLEAYRALEEAQLVIGAKRWIDAVEELRVGQQRSGSVRCASEYRADEIRRIIESAPEKRIALLVSGDSGFCSASAGWLKAISDLPVSVTILPGISSVSALCAKTGISWENAAIFSLHGKQQNCYAALASGEKTILLGADGFEDVLEDLVRLGFGSSQAWIGERLGCADERVHHGTVLSLRGQAKEPLSILMVLPRRDGRSLRCFGIADEEFTRGEVPMTKSEVRAVCMSRLAIGPDDTVYDIGAGTGSISVEASIAAMRGKVYAIERNENAIPLIEENAKKFLSRNLHIVPGEAPQVLRDLPAPDAVMIGGSGGMIREVLECVLEKNPRVRIAATAATLETLQEILKAAELLDLEADYTQILATRIVRRGEYHMMKAQNPVWVISMEKSR